MARRLKWLGCTWARRPLREVDAYGIHAVLHDGIELAGQFRLAYIVLVLAHPDGLRVDLYEFRQRVLQAAGNGNGPAQTDIELREFTRSKFGG